MAILGTKTLVGSFRRTPTVSPFKIVRAVCGLLPFCYIACLSATSTHEYDHEVVSCGSRKKLSGNVYWL